MGETMSDLIQLALSLCATAGTLAEVVKKYEFHGHGLDRERLRKLAMNEKSTR
jgi:hypothetical protein